MRFRFTIRDLLWLTVVIALVVGWYCERSHRSQRIEFLEGQYRTEHGYSIDERIRLIDGLKALGPESVQIDWFNDGFSQFHRNELSAMFQEAGWQVATEKCDWNPPLIHGVKVFFPSTPPAEQKKGREMIALLLVCNIYATPVETENPGFRIEVGQTFFRP